MKTKPPFEIYSVTFDEVMAEWRNRRLKDMRRLYYEHKWNHEQIGALYGLSRQRVDVIMKDGKK